MEFSPCTRIQILQRSETSQVSLAACINQLETNVGEDSSTKETILYTLIQTCSEDMKLCQTQKVFIYFQGSFLHVPGTEVSLREDSGSIRATHEGLTESPIPIQPPK